LNIGLINIDIYVKRLYKSILLTELQKYDNIIPYQIVSGEFDMNRRIMNRKKRRFFQILKDMIEVCGPIKSCVYGTIYDLSFKTGYSYASHATMAKSIGIHKNTFEKFLQELIDDKLIYETHPNKYIPGIDPRIKFYSINDDVFDQLFENRNKETELKDENTKPKQRRINNNDDSEYFEEESY
jgi:hypothetical protein